MPHQYKHPTRRDVAKARDEIHQLLPCPFCGGPAKAEHKGGLISFGCKYGPGRFEDGCDIQPRTPFLLEVVARRVWNTRPTKTDKSRDHGHAPAAHHPHRPATPPKPYQPPKFNR